MSDLAKYEKPLTPVFANKVKTFPFAIHFQLPNDLIPHQSMEIKLDKNFDITTDDDKTKYSIMVKGPEDQEIYIPKDTWVTCVVTKNEQYVVISPEPNISFGETVGGIAPGGVGDVKLKVFRASQQSLSLTTGTYKRGNATNTDPEYTAGNMYFIVKNQKSASFPFGSDAALMEQKLREMSIMQNVEFTFTKEDNRHYTFEETSTYTFADHKLVLVPDYDMDPITYQNPPTPPYRYGFECYTLAHFVPIDMIKSCRNISKQNAIKPNSECIIKKIAGEWVIIWYEDNNDG